MNGQTKQPTAAAPSGQLLQEMGITEQEIAQRKEWLLFGDQEISHLQSLNKIAEEYVNPVIEDLYKHFLTFEEPRQFFKDPQVLTHVKQMQKAYFRRLTQGNYGREYIEERLRVGSVHASIGLDVKWYLGAYAFYIRSIGNRIFDAYKKDPEKALGFFHSIQKLIFLDIGLAIDTYIFQRERTIRKQQEAIRELSTPVLQVRDRLLILPIIGVIDTQRARQLTESLLRAIRDNRARVVVIDITGVAAMDSKVANHLVQTVDASRLMGATAIVTGLSAEIAQTLVRLGVDLGKLNTVGDLQGGLEEAERFLGYKTVATAPAAAPAEQG